MVASVRGDAAAWARLWPCGARAPPLKWTMSARAAAR